MRRRAIAASVAILLPAAAQAGPLAVHVVGAKTAAGRIHVAVCEKRYFMKPDCPITSSAAADPGGVTVTFPSIPPGRYAVMVFHDLNGNGTIDFTPLRLPREPWGLSGRGGLPSFERAAVEIGSAPAAVDVGLRK